MITQHFTQLTKPMSRSLLLVLTLLAVNGCQQSAVLNLSEKSTNLPAITQQQLDYLANNIQVDYRVISNVESDCPDKQDKPVSHCFAAVLEFASPQRVLAKGWMLNFSQVYPIYATESDNLALQHLNGDIHQITPAQRFTGFKPQQPLRIKLWMTDTVITESELMPNYWLAAKGKQPKVIASTKVVIDEDTKLPQYPWISGYDRLDKQIKSHPQDRHQYASAEWLFEHNQGTYSEPELARNGLIPSAQDANLNNQLTLSLAPGISISQLEFEFFTIEHAVKRLNRLGVANNQNGVSVALFKDEGIENSEGYKLTITSQGISIYAARESGAFYALQTVAGLLDSSSLTLPTGEISDYPEYGYRGQHLDVGRNFLSKNFVYQLIEQMAAYKLNRLHLHLAEDEGWRVALPSLPELTQIGAKRCMDLSDRLCLQPQLGSAGSPERDGFYSEQDYMDILRYAKSHHIEVIPSLDMPGHSRAAVKSMEARYKRYIALGDKAKAEQFLLSDPQDRSQYRSIQHYTDNTLNVCMESTYSFVTQVIDDLTELHNQAGVPLNTYHIGADETAGAWKDSPACKAFLAARPNLNFEHLGSYFIERVANMINDRGIAVAGWNDGLGETSPDNMPANTTSYLWATLPDGAHKILSDQAHRGWQLVLSTPDVLYFDFPYEVDPKEPGYNWASRHIDSRDIFNFMPDNLPAHAEFRHSMLAEAFEADDRPHQNHQRKHQPLPSNFIVNGIQGHLWTETVRSEDQAQYMLFPRLLALAERAWHKPDWHLAYKPEGAKYSDKSSLFTQQLRQQRDQQWHVFANTLAHKELSKLDAQGIFYRVPTPGGKIEQGQLTINSSLPGLPMEYKDSNGDWKPYQHPQKVQGKVEIRLLTPNKKRAGRSLEINKRNH